MIELKEIISDNLISLRKANKLTQSELAQKINYSDKAISKWERGEAMPDVETLKLIADIYGVTMDYFVNPSHEDKTKYLKQVNSHKANKVVITSLAVTLIWILATTVFVTLCTVYGNKIHGKWLPFVWALPATMIVTLVFNSIWGRRKYIYAIISILVWTLITSVYLQVYYSFHVNIWLLFFLGLPGEIAVVLWSHLYKD